MLEGAFELVRGRTELVEVRRRREEPSDLRERMGRREIGEMGTAGR
jgi:hypothetical protein